MKKSLIITLVLSLTCSFAFAQGSGYSGIEIYPAGDLFLYSGKDMGEKFKIDLWATTNFEISFSVGPKIGPFATGVGFSMGNPDGVDLMYLNVDVGFGFDFSPIHWQSYNLYQSGQNGWGNFILLRQWISHQKFNWGVIGHNIKIAEEPFNLFWGPYYNFGPIANSSSNKFCVTVDLVNNNVLWATWVIDF